MIIRHYTKQDIPVLVKLLQEGLASYHYGKVRYSAEKVADKLNANVRNPAFFCHLVETDSGEIAGALAAEIVEYAFSYEAFAHPHITYIREGFATLKGITGLVAEYKKWAVKMGASEIYWGQSTGYKMDKFAILARRLGFTQVGTTWIMETKI